MRIASLVPSSTEMLFALGPRRPGRGGHPRVRLAAGGRLPPPPHPHRRARRACRRPRSTAPCARRSARGARCTSSTRERLAELDPDLIVTQAVCDVCAVSYDDVVAVAATLPSTPARDLARPDDARRGARRHAAPRRRGRARPPSRGCCASRHAGGSTPSTHAVAGAPRPRVRRDRVARPAVHRRPLGAGDDRARRRRGRARAGPASARARPSGRRSPRPRPRS